MTLSSRQPCRLFFHVAFLLALWLPEIALARDTATILRVVSVVRITVHPFTSIGGSGKSTPA
jgi:hypothetical protein